jgi:hypothetical protein
MSENTSHEKQMKALLSDLTDAIFVGDDPTRLMSGYDVSADEFNDYTRMVERLDWLFVDVAPSAHFKRTLRADLMGEPQLGMFGRLRKLPPRLQWAAAVALLAAAALLGRKRFSAEFRRLTESLLLPVMNREQQLRRS